MVNRVIITRDLRDAYNYRVAIPLIAVAVFCLMFILVSDQRTTTNLKDTSNDASTSKAVDSKPTMDATLAPRQTLNTTMVVVDPSIPVTPTTINTASPQSSTSSNTSSSTTSESQLQSAATSTGASSTGSSVVSSTTNTNQPSQETIEDLINGASSGVKSITTKTTKGTVNLLNGL